MKHIIWKAFWNYEKEEKWINEMALKGLALTDVSWCRYAFEETPLNEYTYRLELLENTPNHSESQVYIRFLEDSGVECVATYMRWIYLRKKASEGSFDIYTDIDSKIRHQRRILSLWNTMMFIEFGIGLLNLFLGFILPSALHETHEYLYTNIILGFCLISLGFLFLQLSLSVKKKLRKLEKEKTIRE